MPTALEQISSEAEVKLKPCSFTPMHGLLRSVRQIFPFFMKKSTVFRSTTWVWSIWRVHRHGVAAPAPFAASAAKEKAAAVATNLSLISSSRSQARPSRPGIVAQFRGAAIAAHEEVSRLVGAAAFGADRHQRAQQADGAGANHPDRLQIAADLVRRRRHIGKAVDTQLGASAGEVALVACAVFHVEDQRLVVLRLGVVDLIGLDADVAGAGGGRSLGC